MNNSELRLDQHEKAVDLHQRIITSYTLVQKNLWDMCMDLKSMRDEKLYKELGYSEFNDYTQQELQQFVRKLKSYKYALLFLEDVNNIIEAYPDYPFKIKHPIDLLKILGLIKNKFFPYVLIFCKNKRFILRW